MSYGILSKNAFVLGGYVLGDFAIGDSVLDSLQLHTFNGRICVNLDADLGPRPFPSFDDFQPSPRQKHRNPSYIQRQYRRRKGPTLNSNSPYGKKITDGKGIGDSNRNKVLLHENALSNKAANIDANDVHELTISPSLRNPN